MNKFKQLWSNLGSSLWFLPALIVAVSIIFAVALIGAGSVGSNRWLALWPRLFGTGAAGARGMLTTIAGSMMAVVGVAFSMTLMTLAPASSQYTSRILRNFMRSRLTQSVLGIFAGWTDVDLSPHGREEVRRAGGVLKEHGITFDHYYLGDAEHTQKRRIS